MRKPIPSYVRETYRRSIGISFLLFTIALTCFLWNHLATRLPEWPQWIFSFLLVIPIVAIPGCWMAITAGSEE